MYDNKFVKYILWIWIGLFLLTSDGLSNGESNPKSLFLIQAGGYDDTKFGFIDTTGKVVIVPQFEWAGEFSEGLASIRRGHKWGYINTTGQIVINPQFSAAGKFAEGLAVVTIKNKMGYIDKKGNLVIQPNFAIAGDFSEGVAHVGKREGSELVFGYIDKKGQMKITLVPSVSGGMFSEGLAVIHLNHIEIDKEKNNKEMQTEIKSKPLESRPGSFPSGQIKTFEKYGYINKVGEIVIPTQFNFAIEFSESLAAVCVGTKFGYINKNGKMVIQPQFDGASVFCEGLARIVVHGKAGYIDKTASVRIDPQFDLAGDFSEGLAKVALIQKRWFQNPVLKWGYIDKTGKMIIKTQFDKAENFSGGLAKVEMSGISCYIDKTGKIIWKSSK